MATSTLFDNIVVNNPRALEEYVEFRERMAKEPIKPSPGSGVWIKSPKSSPVFLVRWTETGHRFHSATTLNAS